MDIKNLNNSEKIELINQLLKDILETESISALELNDGESILINKKICAEEIANDLLFCGVILDSDIDNEIWWKTDELGGDIKGHIYDYAYENGIKINDI